MHELLEKLSKDVLADALKELNLLYPNPFEEYELESVIDEYYFKFKKYNEKAFLKAIEKYKKSDGNWFPNTNELRFYYSQILRQEKFLKEHVDQQQEYKKPTAEQIEKRRKIWEEKKRKIMERRKVNV